MTVNPQEQPQENSKPTKEDSLVQVRKLYEQQRSENEELRQRLSEVERVAQERIRQASVSQEPAEDDDDDSEPYVDNKRLKKTMHKFSTQFDQKTEARINDVVNKRLNEERQQDWLRNNPDYHDVIQYAKDLHEKDPELLDTISKMPEGFERNKLVYRNIKLLNLHKKNDPEPVSNIQDKINKNRQSPYYQPSGIASAPHNASSMSGKDAYAHMKALQARLTGG